MGSSRNNNYSNQNIGSINQSYYSTYSSSMYTDQYSSSLLSMQQRYSGMTYCSGASGAGGGGGNGMMQMYAPMPKKKKYTLNYLILIKQAMFKLKTGF